MVRVAVPEWYRDLVAGHLDGADPAWYRSGEDLLEAVREADAAWYEIWSAPRPTDGEMFAAAPRLRWVMTSAAGVEHRDLRAYRRARAILTNGAGLHAAPIAENVLLYMLAARRGLPALYRAQLEGRWEPRAAGLRELSGSRILIVGYGLIGRQIGRLARAAGAQVTGARRRGRPGRHVVTGDSWRRLLPETDFLVVAAPLTPATRGLIGATELRALPEGAWLVNIARGQLVVEADLLAELASGRLGGAALDVFDEEPLPEGHPLWKAPNVIITPHAAAYTDRFRPRAAELFLDNLRRFQAGRRLRNVVNLREGY